MGFFSDLFAAPKKQEARNTTNEEVNAILAPLGNKVADYKDRTGVSYTHILPAANSIGVKLLVQARGMESVRRFYEAMIQDLNSKEGIPFGAHIDIQKPPIAPESVAEINGMLWNIANEMIANGRPVEHVAQAFTAFAVMTAERAAGGDDWLVKYLLAQAARQLSISFAGDVDDTPLEPPEDTEEAARVLFYAFRDFTILFKEKSGLEWEHLLPGIQAASAIHFIKERGKANTLDFFQQQIAMIQQMLPPGAPRKFATPPVTPIHITNMAKFNELILEMADRYVTDAKCDPFLTGHALSLLVMKINRKYFDLVRTMAAFMSSCEDIKQGRFDRYRQITR